MVRRSDIGWVPSEEQIANIMTKHDVFKDEWRYLKVLLKMVLFHGSIIFTMFYLADAMKSCQIHLLHRLVIYLMCCLQTSLMHRTCRQQQLVCCFVYILLGYFYYDILGYFYMKVKVVLQKTQHKGQGKVQNLVELDQVPSIQQSFTRHETFTPPFHHVFWVCDFNS